MNEATRMTRCNDPLDMFDGLFVWSVVNKNGIVKDFDSYIDMRRWLASYHPAIQLPAKPTALHYKGVSKRGTELGFKKRMNPQYRG